jgi:hypothetical protein
MNGSSVGMATVQLPYPLDDYLSHERLLPHAFVGEKVAEGRMRG